AADDHRTNMRHRREHSRSADVAVDRLHDGLGLLRRVLERDRPPGRTRDESQLDLLGKAVDLDDDAVNLVLQLMALPLPLDVVLDDLVDRVEPAAVLVDSES